MTTVLLILYGPWALFGVIACIWLLGSLIQWNFGNRKGFRCVYQAIFAILSPLGGILDEFIKKKKPLFIGLNRIFLYSMIALILGTNHFLFLMVLAEYARRTGVLLLWLVAHAHTCGTEAQITS